MATSTSAGGVRAQSAYIVADLALRSTVLADLEMEKPALPGWRLPGLDDADRRIIPETKALHSPEDVLADRLVCEDDPHPHDCFDLSF